MPDQQIDDLVAKITVRNGVATMQTLQGKIYGGGFNLSGTTVDASTPTTKLDAKVAVNQIQVGQVMGGGIAGNQVKGPLSLNLNATGAGESQADLMRSLNGNGNVDGSVMIIGKMEQQVGSALLGVLGSQVKQVQGITSAVNGILVVLHRRRQQAGRHLQHQAGRAQHPGLRLRQSARRAAPPRATSTSAAGR